MNVLCRNMRGTQKYVKTGKSLKVCKNDPYLTLNKIKISYWTTIITVSQKYAKCFTIEINAGE